ncbi:MAG TPA: hemerythrin domain-containing protein [Magnetospirillaceae bacterium]|nr:hemerythrin domain-containing protein [Magnetospirillaceae bacterium]
MATTKKTKAKSAEARKSNPKTSKPRSSVMGAAPDAIDLLTADHEEVTAWFEEYEDATRDSVKADLARKICLALTVHAQIEEELFYPASRKATKDEDLLDEAEVEHAGAKHLIAQIESMKVGDDLYDAKIKVLSEYIKHHVKEEQNELFPEVKAAKLDLAELGAKLAARKEQLMSELSRKAAE